MSDQMLAPVLHQRFLEASGPGSEERVATLVARAQAGDGDSFRQLYSLLLPKVYAYVLARLGSRQDAEDVTAATLERAWASLRRYRSTGSFTAWLFTLVRRAVADHCRRRRLETVPMESLADTLLDPAAGAEERATEADQLRRVLQIIASLSPEQQDVIALRFRAELPYNDIAQVMGKREPAVKMLAYRALSEIRRRYEDENPVSTEK